jgi:hypothetical protein
MRVKVVEVASYDSGTLSAPAFLSLMVVNEGEPKNLAYRLTIQNKNARKLASVQPGEFLVSEDNGGHWTFSS